MKSSKPKIQQQQSQKLNILQVFICRFRLRFIVFVIVIVIAVAFFLRFTNKMLLISNKQETEVYPQHCITNSTHEQQIFE